MGPPARTRRQRGQLARDGGVGEFGAGSANRGDLAKFLRGREPARRLSHLIGTVIRALPASLLALILPLACDDGSSSGPEGVGGKADGLTPGTVCKGAVIDKTVGDGGSDPFDVSQLADPFAQLVLLQGGECPTSFAEVMDRLRETDKEGCDGARDGIRTAIVSETAQAMNRPDSYRAVTMRQCGGRSAHELIFSLFGISSGAKSLPGSFEVTAFDKASRSFNYYAGEGDELEFFGSSIDYIRDSTEARCEKCHPNGMLNMKELDAPWVHWEGDTATPGAQELVDEFDDLGGKTDGAELEGIVDAGNDAMMETRVKTLLAAGDLKEVLRPLFCTVQINLDSATSSVRRAPTSLPPGAFVDTRLGFDNVQRTGAAYKAALSAAGQKVVGPSGSQLADGSNKVVDTVFAFAFVDRAREDRNYVSKLQEVGVIDEDFEFDVLAVDMTNPVFSQARCALLDKAPKIGKLVTASGSPVKGLKTKIRDGFIEALGTPGERTPEAQLLANLTAEGNQQVHVDAARAFLKACDARPKEEFMLDALKVTSLRRSQARELPVMEFPSTLPVDNLKVSPTTSLDPVTCTLRE